MAKSRGRCNWIHMHTHLKLCSTELLFEDNKRMRVVRGDMNDDKCCVGQERPCHDGWGVGELLALGSVDVDPYDSIMELELVRTIL